MATVKEASKELHIPAPTIYRWVQEGLLKVHRPAVGRTRIFVSKQEIRELFEPKPAKRGRK